jgi:adenosine/AMP kinase
MQAAADAAASGMVSVIGLDAAKVAELCKVKVSHTVLFEEGAPCACVSSSHSFSLSTRPAWPLHLLNFEQHRKAVCVNK